MKFIKRIKNRQFILLGTFFVLLSLSYTTNIFRISDSDLFHGFERQPEGLVIGRLVRSAQDGIFSYGGLTGVNKTATKGQSTEQYTDDQAAQHDLYLTNSTSFDGYGAYRSQSGGQGIVLSIVQKICPFDNSKKLMLFRGINAILVALVFCLFAGWIYRNFGFVASLITLILILLSPWLNMYSHNLWWVLWNFYLPFLAMLLALEYKHKYPQKMSNGKVLALLFLATFLKCFFTGFEFITTTLAAAICPIVYYAYLEKKSFVQFILSSIYASITMIAAVLVQMVMLITQIKFLDGTFADGVNHIIHSFTKRTETEAASHFDVLKMYLQDDTFSLGFLPNNITFPFGILLLLMLIVGIFIFLKSKDNKTTKALLLTSAFSILAPLSWLIVFKQHSFEHPHMDYIVWYIPTLLYGYAIIGLAISMLLAPKRKSKLVQKT